MNKVTLKETFQQYKLYIDNCLHLSVFRPIYSLHSWHDNPTGTTKTKYFIELKYGAGPMKTEYDNKELWLNILAELDKIIK